MKSPRGISAAIAALVSIITVAALLAVTISPTTADDPQSDDLKHFQELDELVAREQKNLATPEPNYAPPSSCPTKDFEEGFVKVEETFMAQVIDPDAWLTSGANVIGSDDHYYEVWVGMDNKTRNGVIVVREVLRDPCAEPDTIPNKEIMVTDVDGFFTVGSAPKAGVLTLTTAGGDRLEFDVARRELAGESLKSQ